MDYDYDYGIIGGGPAGYTAGMMLAKQGKSVILFEKDKLGGTCLNKGCIPTKCLLHYSNLYAELTKVSSIGINAEHITLDFPKIVNHKNQTVEKIRRSIELAVKNSGVDVIYAEACVKNKNTIVINSELSDPVTSEKSLSAVRSQNTKEKEYKVQKIVLATGSKPRAIKDLDFDGEFIINSDDILNLTTLPKSILIVGSGAIGIEWARILSNFGVEVNIVELAEHLIPSADIEISKRIERIFKQKKIFFYLNDYIQKVENKTITLNSGKILTPEKVLVAVGRIPVCPKCDCNLVLGDACGEIQLAHYAIHQAKAKILNIPFDRNLIPSVIYGEPEIAWVGIKEQDMDESFSKTILPITALGKAWCDNCTDGFIKLITKNNKIYGAHIISKEASSLIHILLLAIQNNISINDLKKLCYAHPTYAEGIFDILINL